MASDAIGGSITFSTAIDNSDLEKGLEDAQAKVEDLKKKIEEKETERSGIEEQIRGAYEALEEASQAAEELQQRFDYLNSIDISNEQWAVAQMEIGEVSAKLDEARAKETELAEEAEKLDDAYHQADVAVEGYKEQLASAEHTAADLSQRVSSFYYQAGKAMQSSMDSVSQSVANLGNRISRLFTSAMVFNVLRQGLNALKHGIADALMQNEQFSASWTALTSAAQGFANGVANVIAPVVVQVINGVTACVMGLARAIDSVFHTSIGKSISAAQKSAQEAWRQTDASKAAQKQAEANAKAREKQQEQYAKAQERYAKQQEAAQKRAAKAQEMLDKRKAAQEQKYTDAVDDAAERQAKAEQDAAEKMADAQQTAQERMEKAQAKAQERQRKAEESAAKRLEKAQQTAQARMAAAEQSNAEKQQAASERLAKAQEKAAQRQAKAEASAAERLAQAQQAAAEKRASAEQANAERQQAADERLAKAQEAAQKRYEKAQAAAAEKTKAAQEAYDQKVAAAQAKDAKAAAAAEAKQAKAAAKLEKAQKKANETVLGFDELNKMNADSSEDAASATDNLSEYTSALADIKPPKTYSVDPNDYMIDPSDYAAKLKEIKDYSVDASKYAVDPSDYFVDPADYEAKLKEIDPADYFVDPSEYQIDPSDYLINPDDYAIDLEDYAIDPEDFFVDPEDYAFDPSEYVIDPEDYAIDPFSFDWQEFPEIGAEEGLKPNWDAFDVGKIDEKVAAIMAILAGAKLAIGAILAFSGINIPLGIALMALGAFELAGVVGENWEKLPAEVRNAITNALVISGIVLIVIGAILAFTGVATPLGVGLMAAGFALEWTAVALNWASLTPEVQGAVAALMGVLSTAFFALGVILLLAAPDPAHKGIGIGLMLLGAAGMAASVALVWNSLDPLVQQALTTLMVTIGAFAIVIGVVLLLAVPGMQALGVGLILTGVTLLGAAVALNWGQLGETVRPALEAVLLVIGGLCLVIGVVLLFVPGQLALGIGLIIGGIAALGAREMLLDWESLNGQVATKLGEILQTIAAVMLVIGVVLLFVPGQQALGVGLVITGIGVLAASQVALNWEQLNTDFTNALGKIMETVANFMIVIGLILMFVPGQQVLGAGLIIGGIALLTASQVALNWEQLNTDLDTTLSNIVQTIAGYMIIIGIVLLFAPIARAIGVGLIIAGIAALTFTSTEPEWSSLGTKLNEVFGGLLQTIGEFMIVIGIILCFIPPQIPLGVGLIIGGIAAIKVGQVAVEWESLNGKLGEVLQGIVQTIAGAMIVIGILLAFTGAALPLGIGLIVAGAGILAVSEILPNWDFFKDKVAEIWKGITQWWNQNAAKVFTAEWWSKLFMCIPNAIASAINAAIDAFNSFIEGISNALGSLVGATGGSFGGTSSVPSVRPPGLARGAVIPPNRQFMAVLGDQTRGNNIETPEALMRQVVREEAGSMMAEMMMQMQAMGTGQQQAEGGDVVLQIDSETIARASAKGSSMATRRGVLSPQASFI